MAAREDGCSRTGRNRARGHSSIPGLLRERTMNATARILRDSVPEPMSGCWLWTGAMAGPGYGHLRFEGEPWYAHRLSWCAFKGPIPAGFWILHRCDVPSCVNPDHLFVGTAKDNAQDREWKGRGVLKVKQIDRPAAPPRVWPDWQFGVCCRRGHPWTPETTYWHLRQWGERTRGCLICKRQRERALSNRARKNEGPF